MHSLNQLMAGATLADTLTRVEADIRRRPADADLRAAFVQLLCLAGNWPRAQMQLKSWLAMKPQAQPTVTLLEQAVAGEMQRADVFAGQAQPRMPGEAFGWASLLLGALQADVAGLHSEAETLRASAFEAVDVNPATLTEQGSDALHSVEWLIDGDVRLGPICELIVNGRYTWLPFAAVSELRFQALASATDLVWRHTLVRLIDGSEQVCQIPVRYPFASDAADALLLGSVTEWHPLGEQFIGHGQKTWLSAEANFPLLNLDVVTFNPDGRAP
ncbi:type VI secretion system accessory protein TagJ [Erwinia sp. 9145]|uniref:type VI secretion system accessory protein TagJ n=1 Tax=Erwinia sp. 9145 TaxID=1500895 RepID=UPI0005515C7C|nr:type VI secretion system accessory protein TagJ [Erwinia sp. 9145]